MKARILVAAAAAALLCAPAPASARSLVVDDDAGCPDATFTTIQSAIDAAADGDVVRVCPGVYRELVTVGPEVRRLKLVSRVRHAAVIEAPASAPQFRGGVVEIGSHATLFRGFTVRGPLPADPGGGCAPHTGVEVLTGGVLPGPGAATIDHNRIEDLSCAAANPVTTGVRADSIEGLRLTVAHNDVSGYTGTGLSMNLARPAIVHDNRFDGSGGADTRGIVVPPRSRAKVTSNDVVDHGRTGILADGFEDEGYFVSVHGNRVLRNGTGILVRLIGAGVGEDPPLSRVTSNWVMDSAGDGIDGVDTFATLFRGNVALGSGGVDCRGRPGGRQIWQDNTGRTSDPPGLCREP